MTIYQRIKSLRESLGMTQQELAEKVGFKTASAVNKIELGLRDLNQGKIVAFANALHTTPGYLMGWEDSKSSESRIPNGFMLPPATVKKPRLGVISCGVPINSEENFDGYDDVPEHINCDFTLKCEGDSMIGARINDGDLVYIRQQPTVENGQIAAVLVDGCEKLLKRVYINDDSIILQAENPAYPPRVFSKEDMNRVSIIGRAVGFTSVL
nr:MAG TPA: LexA repressor [Caudoviricetes sp.]